MGASERQGRDDAATEMWDATVNDLVRILGDLALLSAAATGEREVVEQIQAGAEHVARAAALALPRSRFGRPEAPAVAAG